MMQDALTIFENSEPHEHVKSLYQQAVGKSNNKAIEMFVLEGTVTIDGIDFTDPQVNMSMFEFLLNSGPLSMW